MSLLDRQRIPLVMIQGAAEDNFEFEEAIGILETFSLINTYPYIKVCDQVAVEALCSCTAALGDTVQVFYDMHRLVQNATREWLQRPENNRSPIADKALLSIARVHIRKEKRSAEKEISTTREFFDQAPEDPVLTEVLIQAHIRLAAVLIDQGNYAEAQSLLEDAIKPTQNVHEQEHPLVWCSLELLGVIKGLREKYDEARKLLAHVISQRKELYGEMHFATLIARGYYFVAFDTGGKSSRGRARGEVTGLLLQRKYTEAETSLKRLIELPPESGPRTKYSHVAAIIDESTSRELLRICLDAQGKTDEERVYRYSPPPSSSIEDQFEDARVLHQKSRDLCEKGNFDGAEATAREELKLRMQYAGLDDVHTQTCLCLLARSLFMQKCYDDAQTLNWQVLAYRERVHGSQDPRTQNALGAMAARHRHQGAQEEAEECYRRQLCWVENTVGKLDVSTFRSRSDLASVLCDQRKHSEAEELDRLESAGGS
ncbi:MAG: hypothetical protein Q9181_002099 [Wetmoreana brouardii]